MITVFGGGEHRFQMPKHVELNRLGRGVINVLEMLAAKDGSKNQMQSSCLSLQLSRNSGWLVRLHARNWSWQNPSTFQLKCVISLVLTCYVQEHVHIHIHICIILYITFAYTSIGIHRHTYYLSRMNYEYEEDLLKALCRFWDASWRILSREAPQKPVRINVSWRCKMPLEKNRSLVSTTKSDAYRKNTCGSSLLLWLFCVCFTYDLLKKLLRKLSFCYYKFGCSWNLIKS